MDQESFESSVKSKLGGGEKAPSSIWTGISGSLNDQAIVLLQTSQRRHRWVAAAAIFIAVLSFALNFDSSNSWQNSKQQMSIASNSFNALLPTESGHFRFYEPIVNEPLSDNHHFLWSTVLLFKEEKQKEEEKFPIRVVEDQILLTLVDLHEVGSKRPEVSEVPVVVDFKPYYLVRSNAGGDLSRTRSVFWAGIEAGAGNFDPDFTGTELITANVDFDALANSIGQDGFVNPTTTASQNSMSAGVVTSLGVDFGVKMGKKWTLESGLQYANVQNQTSALLNVSDVYTIKSEKLFSSQGDLTNPLVDTPAREAEVEESFEHDVNLESNFRFTSVPVKAGYFIVDDRVSLRLNAGFAANYLVGSKLTDPTGQLESFDQSNTYNTWSFDGLTGFELGYSLFDNVNLTLEPNYRRSITPLSTKLNTRSGFMLQTGLRYTIK